MRLSESITTVAVSGDNGREGEREKGTNIKVEMVVSDDYTKEGTYIKWVYVK